MARFFRAPPLDENLIYLYNRFRRAARFSQFKNKSVGVAHLHFRSLLGEPYHHEQLAATLGDLRRTLEG